jgi:pimeloyl-ACP methyl ester carboxylesterase
LVRLFATNYISETAAIVLVDASHEEQERLMIPFLRENSRKLWESKAMQPEGLLFTRVSREVKEGAKFPDNIPLLVLTAGLQEPHHTNESKSIWMELQCGLLRLSGNSKQIVLEDSGHNIPIEQPKAIVKAIQGLLNDLF